MKKIPYFNDADHVVFMGGVMVPPGETRLVDEALIVPAPAADDDGGNDDGAVDSTDSFDTAKLEELLKGKQEDVLKALPGLSLDEVEALGDLEQEGKARQGILGAVAERLLESAADSEQQ